MKRMMFGAIVLGLLAGPAMAQPKQHTQQTTNPDADKAKQNEMDAVDRQYRSTVNRLRGDAPADKTDPWSNMRGTEQPKAKR